MRGKTLRGACLLAAWLALATAGVMGQTGNTVSDNGMTWVPLMPPLVVRGQTGNPVPEYAPADPQLPIPTGSTRPEDGGLYFTTEFMFFRWNNPLRDQLVAQRGFIVTDNSVPGFAVGQQLGSGQAAMNVDQLTGQDSYQPGFRLGVGWKMNDGSAVSLSYFRLTEASYRAGATLAAPGLLVGQDYADSFLFSNVYNFPPEFSGANNKVLVLGAGLRNLLGSVGQFAFGAWNGASVMQESYLMRFQEWDLTYRQIVYETEDYRLNGLVGARMDWLWDRYRWLSTTYSSDLRGGITSSPFDIAAYNNVTSNRLWGVDCGCQAECYLGHGFALMGEVRTAAFVDFVHEIASYETAAKFYGTAENKRGKRAWEISPEVQGTVTLMWYPWENIQVQVGYQIMAFFNTLSSPRPIDFDYTNIAPHWSTTTRVFDGWMAGFALTF
jgi:hypothetical protein